MGGPPAANGADRALVGQGMKRSRLLLVVIVIAVAVLSVSLWVGEGPLWRLVMLRTVPFQDTWGENKVRGWRTYKRWHEYDGKGKGPRGDLLAWYVETGFKAAEGEDVNEVGGWVTTWEPDGTVRNQMRFVLKKATPMPRRKADMKSSPPWWWGVTDQTEPTAPWWEEE